MKIWKHIHKHSHTYTHTQTHAHIYIYKENLKEKYLPKENSSRPKWIYQFFSNIYRKKYPF